MAKDPAKEVELQAVLIADNFDKCFLPLSVSSSLLPFCGLTILDYALEFLSLTDVKELFILASKQSDIIRNHVKKNWSRSDIGFSITVFSSNDYRSFGDAMRDIDKKGVIKSDFILLQSGVICNSNLKDAVLEHKTRRIKDKNCVMTSIYSDCSPNHPCRARANDILVAVQSETKRLLFLQNVAYSTTSLNVPIDIFMQHENVSTRFDILDCNIAVCSPQVPVLFSDNFDFESRRDVIKEILTNDEILGYQMHVHVLQDKNAAFIGDYHSLLKASQLTLERYFTPMLPDSLMLDSDEAYFFCLKRNVYVHKHNQKVSKSAKLAKNVVIGRNCQIDNGVLIENSVIGENCVIGENSVIKNSILWNNVTVGSSCSIFCSLACSNVTLSDNVVINERSILLKDISIKPNSKIECGSLLSYSDKILDDSNAIEMPPDVSSKKLFNVKIISGKKDLPIWQEWYDIQLLKIHDEDLSENETKSNPGIISGQTSSGGGDVGDSSDEDTESFYSVVLEILCRGYEEKIECANLILEINCAKPTYNVSLDVLTVMLTKALLEVAKSKNLLGTLQPMLQHFLPLLKKYFESEQAKKNMLNSFSNFCLSNKDFAKHLKNVLFFLYENDVLTEDAILEWNSNLDKSIAKELVDFIEWLNRSDEDSSEEDS